MWQGYHVDFVTPLSLTLCNIYMLYTVFSTFLTTEQQKILRLLTQLTKFSVTALRIHRKLGVPATLNNPKTHLKDLFITIQEILYNYFNINILHPSESSSTGEKKDSPIPHSSSTCLSPSDQDINGTPPTALIATEYIDQDMLNEIIFALSKTSDDHSELINIYVNIFHKLKLHYLNVLRPNWFLLLQTQDFENIALRAIQRIFPSAMLFVCFCLYMCLCLSFFLPLSVYHL